MTGSGQHSPSAATYYLIKLLFIIPVAFSIETIPTVFLCEISLIAKQLENVLFDFYYVDNEYGVSIFFVLLLTNTAQNVTQSMLTLYLTEVENIVCAADIL